MYDNIPTMTLRHSGAKSWASYGSLRKNIVMAYLSRPQMLSDKMTETFFSLCFGGLFSSVGNKHVTPLGSLSVLKAIQW